ncbi:2-succinyl-5-enolpyruvyl-6-hydroxy-3-cyclohexene-1-carboxylic-acid synthase [Jiulongibacter sp. NS-SX5]|uniref:2-succinyl-5-enolpyruvyl-6-hydroxy-3- cyclohexene-1-carboxylic-acid synthase n=1 Tax=Jiulongibacter sp. NS-SX5 TaxID=3463854 RepID=UPI0040585D19
MEKITPFRQLARLCKDRGIENVIISPGSRNALLTIAFTAQEGLRCYSVSDERSAAYMALGMALQTGKTSVIICTSGTAVLNYAPAVAEAYFQEVPLLVLTADRPPEWIHQYDGQTIFQEKVFGRHVKKDYEWPVDLHLNGLDLAESSANEAINLTLAEPKGPVHINIPISEPFYPKDEQKEEFTPWLISPLETQNDVFPTEDFNEFVHKYNRKLLVIGQQHNEFVRQNAIRFAKKFGFTLISDTISNCEGGIRNQDIFLKNRHEEGKKSLKPDFLLTMGMSLISKSLKLLLREYQIEEHWHVQDNPAFIDPFRSITRKVKMTAQEFILKAPDERFKAEETEFARSWVYLERKAVHHSKEFFLSEAYSEFHVLHRFIEEMPANSVIHVGNSMSVRYLNALASHIKKDTEVYSNRGTSGIDGSLSTAVGQALKTGKTVFCVLGDVSFQYDKNALWNRYLPDNLKIIILNNSGGIIFNMIQGPNEQMAFNDFFKTYQPHKADLMAKEYGLDYYSIQEQSEVNGSLEDFLNSTKKSILEVFTDYETNSMTYKKFLNTYGQGKR